MSLHLFYGSIYFSVNCNASIFRSHLQVFYILRPSLSCLVLLQCRDKSIGNMVSMTSFLNILASVLDSLELVLPYLLLNIWNIVNLAYFIAHYCNYTLKQVHLLKILKMCYWLRDFQYHWIEQLLLMDICQSHLIQFRIKTH